MGWRRRTWSWARGSVVALAIVTGQAGAASGGLQPHATTSIVTMSDNVYSPVHVSGVVGLTGITWRNRGTVFHTATNARHPRWFDVVLDEGESGGTVVRFAGTFPYVCRYHTEMRGSLAVAPRLEPPGGSTGDTLTLVLADEDPAASGFAFDVQRRRDGRAWVDLGRFETATADVVFGRAGSFELRARLVDTARDRAGRWSPVVIAEITGPQAIGRSRPG